MDDLLNPAQWDDDLEVAKQNTTTYNKEKTSDIQNLCNNIWKLSVFWGFF